MIARVSLSLNVFFIWCSIVRCVAPDYGGLKWKATLIPIPEESKVESPPVTVMCVRRR